MKKIKNLIFVCMLIVWCVGFTSADLAGYEIKDYQADFELTSSGLLKARERLDINFTEPRHWIYRDIPFKYPKSDYLLKTPISNVVVLWYDFSDFENGNDYRIKIWSPNYKVNGNQFYDISYEISGAVREFTGYQELYWNMLGTNWWKKIENFNFSVLLPSDLELEPEIEFYAVGWVRGSKDRVKLEKNGRKIQNTEPLSLLPYEAITIAVKLPENYVPVEEFRGDSFIQDSYFWEKEEFVIFENKFLNALVEFLFFLFDILKGVPLWICLIALFLIFLLFAAIWDLWKKTYFILFQKEKSSIRNVVYYAPPKNIPISEFSFLYHKAPCLDVVFAELYDWSVKGYISFQFEHENMKIVKQQLNPDFSSDFWSGLWKLLWLDWNIEFLLSEQMENHFSFFKSLETFVEESFTKNTAPYYSARSLKKLGTQPLQPSIKSPKNYFLWILVFALLLFPLFLDKIPYEGKFIRGFFLVFGFVMILLGMISKIVNSTVLEYTDYGASVYEQILGFKKNFESVEERKLKKLLEEDPQYFDKMLPYAVAFGMGIEWIEKCKDVLIQLNYKSSTFEDVHTMDIAMSNLMNASAFSQPTSSWYSHSRDSSDSDFGSDSGFDSDGGSSGGGGWWGGGGSR